MRKSKSKSKPGWRYRSVPDLLDQREVAYLLGRKTQMSQKELIVWRHAAQALQGNLSSLQTLLWLANQEPDKDGGTSHSIKVSN